MGSKLVSELTPTELEARRAYAREYARTNREKNKEREREACKRWADKNRQRERARNRLYRAERPSEAVAYNRQYRLDNPEYQADWRRANHGRAKAYLARYRAAKLAATPLWADLRKIQEIYQQASDASASDGLVYEVDHIVPLQGVGVCGLHVHWNLRVITQSANRKKGNRWDA